MRCAHGAAGAGAGQGQVVVQSVAVAVAAAADTSCPGTTGGAAVNVRGRWDRRWMGPDCGRGWQRDGARLGRSYYFKLPSELGRDVELATRLS